MDNQESSYQDMMLKWRFCYSWSISVSVSKFSYFYKNIQLKRLNEKQILQAKDNQLMADDFKTILLY